MTRFLGTASGPISATNATETVTEPATGNAWSFILDYKRAPMGLSANDRPRHWAIKHGSTQDVRAEVMAKTRALNLGELSMIRVDLEWVVGDRRTRDTDNLAPFAKAIYDGIGSNKGVSARLVEDDSQEFMDKPGATIRYEKGARHHFVVTITDLGDAL